MEKVCTLAEAVASIPTGAHVALSGFAITRCCMAFAREVIRQGITDLTLSQCVGAMDADLLAGAGAVKRIIYGGGSLDRFGRLAWVNRGIETGSLVAEEYSSLSIALRYLAGALGLPFIPIRSLAGSDLLKQIQKRDASETATVCDPFTGENWLALKPLIPDVAVIQVQAADSEGNAWVQGPKWDNGEQARAAKRTILITEQLLSSEQVRQAGEQTFIPGVLVSHVVVLPFGAHPCSVYRVYDYDAREIEAYVEAGKSVEAFKTYLDQTVYRLIDHAEYLEKVVGPEQLEELRADPVLGY
jgi:acyl CoA:acetate/3-ketoacid CoA transferase alpha subunit